MHSRNGQLYEGALAVLAAATLMVGTAVCSYGQASPAHPASRPASKVAGAAADSKVVMRVGKEGVTKAEFDQIVAALSPQTQQTIATQGKRTVGDQFAVMMVLDQQAEKDHLDANPEIRRELELAKRQLLAQAEYRKLAEQNPVTPDDVSQYFNAHKDDFDTVDLYEIMVRKKAPDAKADDPGLSQADAQSKVNAIRAALTSGASIDAVAKQFAMPNVVMIDATPRTVRHGQLWPALDKQAFSLNNGQVSESYETPQGIGLFQVATHQPATLKDVAGQIENELRQEKLQAQVDALKKSANVWLDGDYFKQASAPAKSTTASPSSPGPAPNKP